MAIRFRPPKPAAQILPQKPDKGHFLFAGRQFKRVPWWKRKNMRVLYFFIVLLILTNTANGFDGSMMNGLQSLTYWQDYFGHPRGSILGLFNSSMSLGSLIGLFFTPYIIDWWGRKVGLALGSFIMLLAVGLQSGAQNFGMFVAARIVLGFGDTIVLGSAPLLIAEIAHPQDRAVLVTLSGASYHSGSFIASWVTFGTLKIPVCYTVHHVVPLLGKYGTWLTFASCYRAIGLGGCLVFSRRSAPFSSSLASGGCRKAPDGC